MKLLIETHTYNRKKTADICLQQIKEFKCDADFKIVNDYSTEYDNSHLEQFSDNVIMYEKKLTINKLKYRSFKEFISTDYTHLYMCDNDIFHDPNFVYFLKKYSKNNLPLTLYRSSFIHSFGDNVSKYHKIYDEISVKSGLYGGASVLLNREHIEKIVNNLPDHEDLWDEYCTKTAWDSRIQHMIDPKRLYLIPNESLCEHFGIDGQNHKHKNSDYALDPSEYLKKKSASIWGLLL